MARAPASAPPPAARRRRRALAAFALAALLLGALVGARGGADSAGPEARAAAAARARTDAARAAVAAMPLRRQVGELLVIAFRGTTAPDYVLRALQRHRVAGVILFRANAPSAASVRALTARLQRAAAEPAIVCLDQEGGSIRSLAFAPSAIGQAGQPTPAAARAAAAATGQALHAAGVNVVLGPVADVAAGNPGSMMAARAYPGGASAVAQDAAAAAAAYEAAGVAPTLKHFPGLGGARANTDWTPSVTVPRTAAQLAADLLPYRRVVTPLVMVSHARYPALDAHRIASQSPAIVTDLLRGQLGFAGVAMTDSMEARASLASTNGDVGRAAVRAVAAGIDLVLTTGRGSFLPVRDALLAAARRSPRFRARVAEAAARVVALRATLGRVPH